MGGGVADAEEAPCDKRKYKEVRKRGRYDALQRFSYLSNESQGSLENKQRPISRQCRDKMQRSKIRQELTKKNLHYFVILRHHDKFMLIELLLTQLDEQIYSGLFLRACGTCHL